jgi:uncharacterized RDD family membrane protein YckC
MTQSPDNVGGQPEPPGPAVPPPGDEEVSPLSVPPPATWHFPAEPAPVAAVPPPPPPAAPLTAPANGSQAPYGTSPHYGTPQDYGAPGQRPRGPVGYGTGHPAYQGGPPGQDAGLAEWWRRLLGRLIDVVVVSIVLVPVTIPLLSGPFGKLERVTSKYPNLSAPGAQTALSRADGKFVVALWILGIIAAVVWFLYDTLQHAKWGQTLGKRVLSTRVVSAYDRSPITGAAAVKRAAVYALVPVLPVVGTIFAVLNDLWLLWDRRRQCLHDKAARTIVIKTKVPAGGPGQGSPW